MIMCDFCQEWYHGICIDITPGEAQNIDKFRCGKCKGSRANRRTGNLGIGGAGR